jgi:hypothetical protein
MADGLLPLIPYKAAAESAPILRAGIERTTTLLSLRWVVGGAVTSVRMPTRAAAPRRADDLWTHTCFEAFIGAAGSEAYWEINVSPSGDWNVYRFDGYRRGMRPETRLTAVSALERASCGTVTLRAGIDLSSMPELAHGGLDTSLAAVLEATDGTLSYWSIVHGASRPDFHRRESFVLRLTEE